MRKKDKYSEDDEPLLLLRFAFITFFCVFDNRWKVHKNIAKKTVSWEPKLSMSTHRICMQPII